MHSCDRWFINPSVFDEPTIHTQDLDKVDLPTDTVLSDEVLWAYFEQVRDKIRAYLRALTDIELCEKPSGCENTRMELILAQIRHFNVHVGIFERRNYCEYRALPMCVWLGIVGASDA